MLLAWNYQNSSAGNELRLWLMRRLKVTKHPPTARNGTEGPDLSMMNGLWSHYQTVMAAAEKNTSLPNGNNVSSHLISLV